MTYGHGRIGTALAALVLVTGALAGCGSSEAAPVYDPAASATMLREAVAGGLSSPKLTVLDSLQHSTDAWTEGLEIADGKLYEGTGLAGRSELRELDPKTGKLIRASPLPTGLYGGGITVVGPLIWQLTRQNGIALQWNRDTLNAGGRVPFQGQGWGLCHNPGDGELVASDGSATLKVIDSNGVKVVQTITATVNGRPLAGLDELECLPRQILANVAGTSWIVTINPSDGRVVMAVDAAKLVPVSLKNNKEQVLNGIAAVPGSTDTFLLTGRFWPTMYKVRFGRPSTS